MKLWKSDKSKSKSRWRKGIKTGTLRNNKAVRRSSRIMRKIKSMITILLTSIKKMVNNSKKLRPTKNGNKTKVLKNLPVYLKKITKLKSLLKHQMWILGMFNDLGVPMDKISFVWINRVCRNRLDSIKHNFILRPLTGKEHWVQQKVTIWKQPSLKML